MKTKRWYRGLSQGWQRLKRCPFTQGIEILGDSVCPWWLSLVVSLVGPLQSGEFDHSETAVVERALHSVAASKALGWESDNLRMNTKYQHKGNIKVSNIEPRVVIIVSQNKHPFMLETQKQLDNCRAPGHIAPMSKKPGVGLVVRAGSKLDLHEVHRHSS